MEPRYSKKFAPFKGYIFLSSLCFSKLPQVYICQTEISFMMIMKQFSNYKGLLGSERRCLKTTLIFIGFGRKSQVKIKKLLDLYVLLFEVVCLVYEFHGCQDSTLWGCRLFSKFLFILREYYESVRRPRKFSFRYAKGFFVNKVSFLFLKQVQFCKKNVLTHFSTSAELIFEKFFLSISCG